MSISHKAWPFDETRFQAELAPILYAALQDGDEIKLRAFIYTHRDSMTDLWDNEPLRDDWETSREEPNACLGVQCLADIALSRYHDREDEWGLRHDFDALGAYFDSIPALRTLPGALICGYLFGPRGKRLDPGYQGTGIVSVAQAREHLHRLQTIDWPVVPDPKSPLWAGVHYRRSAEEVLDARDRLVDLYLHVVDQNLGILFADFNDCGVGRR